MLGKSRNEMDLQLGFLPEDWLSGGGACTQSKQPTLTKHLRGPGSVLRTAQALTQPVLTTAHEAVTMQSSFVSGDTEGLGY